MRVVLILLFCTLNQFLFGQNDFTHYYNQGLVKYSKRNYNEAAGDFTNALKNKDAAKNEYHIADAYMQRAYCKMHMKSYKSAIEDISDAIKLKPEYSDLYYAKSRIHLESKQYDECIATANKGLELKPQYEELILLKAKAKSAKKNYAEAMNDIDTLLITINPRNLQGWCLKGEIFEAKKDYKNGADAYTKAIEIDVQDFGSFYNRGICRAYMKDFKGALEDMNRGMAIDSTEKWIGYNNIAFFIKFEQKDYEGAIQLFNEAIKLNPKFSYAYNNRGYAKLQLNDLKGAREDIMKGMDLNDENSYGYKTYAQLLIAEKKEKLACEKLKKANELGYTEEYDEEVNELIKAHCK